MKQIRFYKQNKATTIHDAKNLPTMEWITDEGNGVTALHKIVDVDRCTKQYNYETKYDGAYIQIHKVGTQVKFFTSGGKEFYLPSIASLLKGLSIDFMLEAEYIGDGIGKLGGRTSSSLMSFVTDFKKGKTTIDIPSNIRVFSMRLYGDKGIEESTYMKQRQYLNRIINSPRAIVDILSVVFTSGIYDTYTLKHRYEKAIKDGYEGLMLKEVDYIGEEGKRRQTVIKLKPKYFKTLTCTGTTAGKGKYEGMIGALELVDEKGVKTKVSPKGDEARSKPTEFYIGKQIEISYESFIGTYIQPIFNNIIVKEF